MVRTFHINMGSVGYKSGRFLEVKIHATIREVPAVQFVDLLGPTKQVVDIEFIGLNEDQAEGFINEMIAIGGTREMFFVHLKQLLSELILFGVPYSGYKVVQEWIGA